MNKGNENMDVQMHISCTLAVLLICGLVKTMMARADKLFHAPVYKDKYYGR